MSLREATLSRAYEDIAPIVESDIDRQPLLDFFDYLVHDSVAGFGKDFSKLEKLANDVLRRSRLCACQRLEHVWTLSAVLDER